MIYKNNSWFGIFFMTVGFSFLFSCAGVERKADVKISNYEQFRDSVLIENSSITYDTSNILDDDTLFAPGVDSVEDLLIAIDTMLYKEITFMERMDSLIKNLKKMDSFSMEEKKLVRENILVLDSFLEKNKPEVEITCREKSCYLYAEIIKSKQMLYLHIDGALKDSFRISSGSPKYATPNMSIRPSGPLFTKYTSRKFPGGNYKGLGNMPYAVFIRGGYAIHGTTQGNIPKLGTVASHGCIRLHPDNARVFYELVKMVGLSNTWVIVRDSL